MTGKVLMILAVVVALLTTAGCKSATKLSTEREAISQAKDYVMAEVRKEGAEISNIEVVTWDTQAERLSPAEKAKGIQGRANVNLRFACRCPGGEWLDGYFGSRFQKEAGRWETMGGSEVLSNPCTCGYPTPTPIPFD